MNLLRLTAALSLLACSAMAEPHGARYEQWSEERNELYTQRIQQAKAMLSLVHSELRKHPLQTPDEYNVILPSHTNFFGDSARETGAAQMRVIFDALAHKVPLENQVTVELRPCVLAPWFEWVLRWNDQNIVLCMPYRIMSNQYITIQGKWLEDLNHALGAKL